MRHPLLRKSELCHGIFFLLGFQCRSDKNQTVQVPKMARGPHSSVVRASVVYSGGCAFEPWAGTDIYVPAIWGQQYPLANKGYAGHEKVSKVRLEISAFESRGIILFM